MVAISPEVCLTIAWADAGGTWMTVQRHVPALLRCLKCDQVMTICRLCDQRLVTPGEPRSLPPVRSGWVWMGADQARVRHDGILWLPTIILAHKCT